MILANTYPYTGNGLGGLPDAIEAIVSHEINGIYELMFRYPVTGLHFDDLANGNIVMAEPDALTSAQPFRIYRITKPLNGVVTVYARHICYDMQGIICEPFTATDLTTAFQTIPTKLTPANSFNFSTTRTVATGMSIVEPRPLWKLIGGQAGSILDVYGGEWDFDGYDAKLVTQLGTDRGVRVSYGKNMTELEQDGTIEGTYSGVYPYWYDEESSTLVTIPEKFVTVPNAEVSNRVFTLDCSDDFDTQPTQQQLRDRANAYILANSIGNARTSWKVSFADNPELMMDRVMLGDTLHVRYERIGVDATARAVKTEYDVLAKHYKAITVGRVKQNLAAIIVAKQEETASQFAQVKSDLETAVDDATDFIRNGAGYMRFIYNANEELTEIVSLDDPDISQATNVWRWNNGGFGFSSTGYNGTYNLAITQNGAIVADFITAGTLNANVIKAGILQDAANKNSWNMTTGALTITNGSININSNSQYYDLIQLNYDDGTKSSRSFISPVFVGVHGKDANGEHEISFSPDALWIYGTYNGSINDAPYAQHNASGFTLFSPSPHKKQTEVSGYYLRQYDTNETLRQQLNGDGKLWQYDGNGKLRTYLEYGEIYLKNASEVTRQHIASDGSLEQYDASGVRRSRLSWGDLYLYDANGVRTVHADDASAMWLERASDNNAAYYITDTAATTRARLAMEGLRFYDANNKWTAHYPAALFDNATVGGVTPYSGRCTLLGGAYRIGNLVMVCIQLYASHTATNTPRMATIGFEAAMDCPLTCIDITNGIGSAIEESIPCGVSYQGYLFMKKVTNGHTYAITGVYPYYTS